MKMLANATSWAGNHSRTNIEDLDRQMFAWTLAVAQDHWGGDDPILIADARYGENRDFSVSWWRWINRTDPKWKRKWVRKLTPYKPNPNSRNEVSVWIVDPAGIPELIQRIKVVDWNWEPRPNYYPGSPFVDELSRSVWRQFPACCGVGVLEEWDDMGWLARILTSEDYESPTCDLDTYERYLDDPDEYDYNIWGEDGPVSFSFVLMETEKKLSPAETALVNRIKDRNGSVWTSKAYGNKRYLALGMACDWLEPYNVTRYDETIEPWWM